MIARHGSAVNARSTAARDREDAVVARLHDLAPHLDGEPDPAFREAMRARLVAMAAVRSPEPEPVSPLRRLLAARASDAPAPPWRARLTAGLAGAALTVTALSALVALADGARPGDVLYPLKRGTEQTQLALAGDARGQTLLDFASTRLGELQYLVSEEATALPAAGAPSGSATQIVLAAGADPELVVDTLDTMDAQTTEGAAWLAERAVATDDTAPLDDLATWTSAQSAGLAALEDDVPAEAREALGNSLELLTDISTRTTVLLPVLDCASGPATDGADDLGPLPGACAAGAPTDPGTGGGPGTAPGTGGTSTDGPSGVPSTESPGGVTGTLGPGSGGTDAPGGGGAPGSSPNGGGLPPNTGGGVPTPSVPAPTLPPVTVPSITVPLPGSSTGSSTGRSTGSVGGSTGATPSLDVEICIGPIQIGSC